tara:strand:- start:1247 stop:1432 length:186 start_codon:yes stop_codon:yes gene_type:complete
MKHEVGDLVEYHGNASHWFGIVTGTTDDSVAICWMMGNETREYLYLTPKDDWLLRHYKVIS